MKNEEKVRASSPVFASRLRPGRRRLPQEKLIAAAVRAREHAVAPYSKFKVGAALLTKGGEIISGANVESASYGLTCCAERVALFSALTGGKKDFIAVAVVARCTGRPDAVRGVPPVAGGICAGGDGVGGGQPGLGQDQGIHGAGTAALGVCHSLKFSQSKVGWDA